MVGALAGEGARVVIHYHSSPAEAERAVAEIRARGGEAEALRADLAAPGELERLAEEAEALFGGVDVLVNSAATFAPESIAATDPALWERTLALNLRAPFFLTRRLAPAMRSRGSGVVVNLLDLAGLQAWRGYAAHGIAKAGLAQLTLVAAREFAPEVRVVGIAPGTVLPPEDTPPDELRRLAENSALKRIGTPADVTQALLFLLRADFVTGEVLVVDGGRRITL